MMTVQLSTNFSLLAGGMGLYMLVFFAFFIFVAVAVVSTLAAVPRVKRALAAVSANPCEQTAQALGKVLQGLGGIQRFLLGQANGFNGGISKVACTHIYNNLVAAHPAISMETKTLVLRGLVGIGCTTLHAPRAAMSAEEQRAANEEQGRLGEENVAHTLRALRDFGPYEVFHHVYLKNSEGDSKENDFIVVGPTGLFLLEVKSNRGRMANGVRYVDFSSLDRDPGGQMLQHEGAMRRLLSSMEGAAEHIHNRLVISYAKNDRPPVVNLASFPAQFNACTVDELLHVILRSPADPYMTPERIAAIAALIRENIR